ncbi:hypothetical protein [Nitratidesulfovibrio vulgaris]|uniref:hypothetical protein n=1 Tax=Nitratidesulfovibrio vulgaris TaxID=881 RepID=UPI002300A3AA|nr:hypothetical protein [Nitratidesulfovibrio vulgaris]WCB48204.1 hypothetical protein PH214_16895 [Nitratidesulfovibrio vulgaris]
MPRSGDAPLRTRAAAARHLKKNAPLVRPAALSGAVRHFADTSAAGLSGPDIQQAHLKGTHITGPDSYRTAPYGVATSFRAAAHSRRTPTTATAAVPRHPATHRASRQESAWPSNT